MATSFDTWKVFSTPSSAKECCNLCQATRPEENGTTHDTRCTCSTSTGRPDHDDRNPFLQQVHAFRVIALVELRHHEVLFRIGPVVLMIAPSLLMLADGGVRRARRRRHLSRVCSKVFAPVAIQVPEVDEQAPGWVRSSSFVMRGTAGTPAIERSALAVKQRLKWQQNAGHSSIESRSAMPSQANRGPRKVTSITLFSTMEPLWIVYNDIH
jgi:hypothetical protein